MTAPTFQTAAENLLARLPDKVQRSGRPLSQNTLKAYKFGIERASTHIGSLPLNEINNEVLRDLVVKLRRDNYRAATICGDITVVKLVCESITRNGDPLFPLRINKEFCCLPLILPEEQNAPAATRAQVEKALTIPELRGPVAIAAGCGLRISEILALTVDGGPFSDWYDSESAVLTIRKTLKTPSARRTVPIPAKLNAFIKVLAPSYGVLFPVTQRRIYTLLENADLLPMHSYRRFFATVKDESGMNTGALKRIMGHSKGSDITARYSRASENLEFLRSEMARTPLGFSLEVSA